MARIQVLAIFVALVGTCQVIGAMESTPTPPEDPAPQAPPPALSSSGVCPKNKRVLCEVGKDACETDEQCGEGEACCKSRCGRKCSRLCSECNDPTKKCVLFKLPCSQEPCVDRYVPLCRPRFGSTPKRPGRCPKNKTFLCEVGTVACTFDQECPGTERCCKTRCGRKCTRVCPDCNERHKTKCVLISIPCPSPPCLASLCRPRRSRARCPKNVALICDSSAAECQRHRDCEFGQKCCNTPTCGKRCSAACHDCRGRDKECVLDGGAVCQPKVTGFTEPGSPTTQPTTEPKIDPTVVRTEPIE